jgi:lipopolysaccharide/colanic/teichoic acid biosynthesis glycosyltransferase
MNFLDVSKKKSDVVHSTKDTKYEKRKRIFDVLVSVLALLILFIPLIIIMVIILIDSPGASPIYIQERVGKNGKTFKFYKLRSMRPKADEMLDSLLEANEMAGPVFKIKDDPRITRMGKFLRKTGIDEIPQFFNVIKGDMSIVGPRPPLPREVEHYTNEQLKRISVTPGITCYWQVQPSRNNLSFDEWFELDMKYIEERSFKTDMTIILKTFGAVCGMEGV